MFQKLILTKMATLFNLSSSSNFVFLTTSKPQIATPSITLKRPLSIRCFQSPETTTIPAKVQTFWGWLSDKGIISAKIPVKPGIVAEGLGLVAQKNMTKNEVVVEVPKKFWISPDTVAASEIGSVCSGLKPWVSVALFLMRERKLGDASSWKPYIDILPNSTDSIIYWSEEELNELQGSQLLNTTIGVKDLVASEYSKLVEGVIVPNKRIFPFDVTLNDFVWAFGILRSRAFTSLQGISLVLIPVADMINHSPDIRTQDNSWEVKGAGLFSRDLLFSLRTPTPVKAGDQVLIQYDLNKSNAELALDYGFIESRPERNAFTLTLEIPESDPFYGDKLDIAESIGMREIAYFDVVLDEPLPANMLPYLRLLALGGQDAFLLESIFRNSISGHLELPISRANEELICQVIRNACTSALSGYSTSIEEDEKKLAQSDICQRLKIATGIRLGEKKVLQRIDGIFKERELELGAFEYYQERRLKDLGLAGAQGEKLPWIGEV